MIDMPVTSTRAGFVCIIGLPNAGKSTLVNKLVGAKVSIVSRKVQTTRSRVLGIAMHEEGDVQAQVVLVDTPGVFKPKKTLERAMVGAAWDALEDADIAVHLVDISAKDPVGNSKFIAGKLPAGKKAVLVLNKTDQVDKIKLLALSAELNTLADYQATFMISALKGQGTKDLLAMLAAAMPEGPYLFDPELITDMPMRLMAAEITREKIFNQLHQELPHSTFVHTEQWEEFENGSIKIGQAIHVQRDSQKAIVLGKGGRQIKKIGEAARKELEELLETRVHLSLFVKVQADWAERAENLHLMGLEPGR